MSVEEIVKDCTMYNSYTSRRYLSIAELIGLGERIMKTNTTTGYLRFTPFYVNSIKGRHIEFDEEFMYYVECRKDVTQEDVLRFIEECTETSKLQGEQKPFDDAQKQYMLCDVNDVEGFHRSISAYFEVLPNFIKDMAWQLENLYNVNPEDFLLGSICFEVHCEDIVA